MCGCVIVGTCPHFRENVSKSTCGSSLASCRLLRRLSAASSIRDASQMSSPRDMPLMCFLNQICLPRLSFFNKAHASHMPPRWDKPFRDLPKAIEMPRNVKCMIQGMCATCKHMKVDSIHVTTVRGMVVPFSAKNCKVAIYSIVFISHIVHHTPL